MSTKSLHDKTPIRELTQLNPGDHIRVKSMGYYHHMLVVEATRDNETITVIHYTAVEDEQVDSAASKFSSEFKGVVREETLPIDLSKTEILQFKPCLGISVFSAQESINRARSRLGERSYHLAANNCEHFVNWCKSNIFYSEQAEGGITAILEGVLRGLSAWTESGSLGTRLQVGLGKAVKSYAELQGIIEQ